MRFSTTLVSGLIYVFLGLSIANGASLEYSLERRCASNGSFCGSAGGGVACCAGLFCSSSSPYLAFTVAWMQVCRSCVTNGGFCGSAGGGVPCCSGLFCSSNSVCRSCVTEGGFCGSAGGGVPCCAGLFCSSNSVNIDRIRFIAFVVLLAGAYPAALVLPALPLAPALKETLASKQKRSNIVN
ncbi:hypothetical protein FPV67DRAFT_1456641 [Lyophyllum atratum]|nr:hypothetical protein FPV67DRAFT_1456641 [Lyophyllum atratum]